MRGWLSPSNWFKHFGEKKNPNETRKKRCKPKKQKYHSTYKINNENCGTKNESIAK